jgi:hypothetical protein
MSKHSHPGNTGENPQTDSRRAGDHPQEITGSVRISGQVEAHLPPDLAKKKETADEKKESREKRKFIVECVTMGLVAIYASLTAWQGCESSQLVRTAQDTYNAVDRPYVGIGGLDVFLLQREPDGQLSVIRDSLKRGHANQMSFSIDVKNFGSVPALDVVTHIDARDNGSPISVEGVPDKGSELFPGNSFSMGGMAGFNVYPAIASGKSIFQFDLHISYNYAHQSYQYCVREQYSPQYVKFMNLGDMCGAPWATGR